MFSARKIIFSVLIVFLLYGNVHCDNGDVDSTTDTNEESVTVDTESRFGFDDVVSVVKSAGNKIKEGAEKVAYKVGLGAKNFANMFRKKGEERLVYDLDVRGTHEEETTDGTTVSGPEVGTDTVPVTPASLDDRFLLSAPINCPGNQVYVERGNKCRTLA